MTRNPVTVNSNVNFPGGVAVMVIKGIDTAVVLVSGLAIVSTLETSV